MNPGFTSTLDLCRPPEQAKDFPVSHLAQQGGIGRPDQGPAKVTGVLNDSGHSFPLSLIRGHDTVGIQPGSSDLELRL